MIGQLEQISKGCFTPKSWGGAWGSGNGSGASEDLDDFKVSLWLGLLSAQSWYSRHTCWIHEWAQGKKVLSKWRNHPLFYNARWMAFGCLFLHVIWPFIMWQLLICPARPVLPPTLHILCFGQECCWGFFVRSALTLLGCGSSGLPLHLVHLSLK